MGRGLLLVIKLPFQGIDFFLGVQLVFSQGVITDIQLDNSYEHANGEEGKGNENQFVKVNLNWNIYFFVFVIIVFVIKVI